VKQCPALLPGVFYSLYPCFSLKSNPQHQPCPCCAPQPAAGALGDAWISCFQKGIFLAPPGWDGPWDPQEGWTDPRAAAWWRVLVVCTWRGCAVKLQGTCRDAARGGIYPLVCEITCAVRGVEVGLLRLLSAACCASSLQRASVSPLPEVALTQRQWSRGAGVIQRRPGMQSNLGVPHWMLQPQCFYPPAGAVLLSLCLPPVIPTIGKSQAWSWG